MKPSKAEIVESLDKACKILAGDLEDEPDDPENPDDAEAEAAVSQATHSNDDEEVGMDEDDEVAGETVKPVSSGAASSGKVSEVKASAASESKGLKMDAVPMPKAGTKRPVVPSKPEQPPEKKLKSEKPAGKKKFDWTDPSDDEKEKKKKKKEKKDMFHPQWWCIAK